MGSDWGGAKGYARQRCPSKVLLGAAVPGERAVETSILVRNLPTSRFEI